MHQVQLKKQTFFYHILKIFGDILLIGLEVSISSWDHMKAGDDVSELQFFDIDNKVHVIVKDNAGTIDEKLKEKIFEPFFTTKDMAGKMANEQIEEG